VARHASDTARENQYSISHHPAVLIIDSTAIGYREPPFQNPLLTQEAQTQTPGQFFTVA
jgi:hypothetical protein